ncbi:MAG: DHH family phosphoesterase [Bacillota bacterium]
MIADGTPIYSRGNHDFWEIVKVKKHFLLTVHEHPDGDCLGSMLALGMALKSLGGSILYCCNENLPAVYNFLPGIEQVQKKLPDEWQGEVLISLDCSDICRLTIEHQKISDFFLINIDHHQTNTNFGQLNLVDGNASATGEMIYNLLHPMVKIDYQMALCLMVAIITDTGFFRFANTTPGCLRIAAELMEAGVELGQLAEQLQERKKITVLLLLGELLSSLKIGASGRIAWMSVTKEHLAKYGTEISETEGFVNYAKTIDGVLVGILFKEMDDQVIKVSLRSGPEIDASKIAQYFGGGGHPRAAGCSLKGNLSEAQSNFITYLESQLMRK